jgi:RimJ/RimL family protein N-acetyltransferase
MQLRPVYPVRSARLILRPLAHSDVAALVSYRSLPEVCRYVPHEPMDEETVRRLLTGRWSGRAIEREGDRIVLGAERVEDGLLMGDVTMSWDSAVHLHGEVGYMFHPAYGGQGYATEAVHRLLHLAFDDLGLRRVVARVDADNLPSARLAARIGMRQEAHLVENEWFKGRWGDELDFALLSREWRAMHDGAGPQLGCSLPDG